MHYLLNNTGRAFEILSSDGLNVGTVGRKDGITSVMPRWKGRKLPDYYMLASVQKFV